MERIASGPQLWRLGKEGRLLLVDVNGEPINKPGEPVSAWQAHEAIAAIAAGKGDPEPVELDR